MQNAILGVIALVLALLALYAVRSWTPELLGWILWAPAFVLLSLAGLVWPRARRARRDLLRR